MKTIILILLVSICSNAYAQPRTQAGATNFTPIAEKIKKISSANNLAKMKAATGIVLNSSKLTASNNIALHFMKPDLVTPQEVEFYVNNESTLKGSTFKTYFPENLGGVYVFELNIALFFMVEEFTFKVKCAGVTQMITIANNITGDKEYYDNKLVFAVTIPNSSSRVEILTTSAPWKFRNVEITPMK